LVTVGRVVGPHGLRGEVRVRLETDFPERFTRLRQAFLVRDGRAEIVEITGSRPHRGGVLLAFAGIGDAAAAGRLRGADIAVTRDALMPLAEDAFYIFEVIGLRVRTAEGGDLGAVAEVMRGPAHDVYVVRGTTGEWLLPAVRAVIRRIDRGAGAITVDLPAGLVPARAEPARARRA
jgi:16S rRNA processing protein RimM